MKRYFMVKVKFNLNDKGVIKLLKTDYPFPVDSEGIVEIKHEGNIKSSEKSAINGVKRMLNICCLGEFKRNFQILGAREI